MTPDVPLGLFTDTGDATEPDEADTIIEEDDEETVANELLLKGGYEVEDPGQGALFDLEDFDWWQKYWTDMPEYITGSEEPVASMLVHFRSEVDKARFLALVGEPPTRLRSIWWPGMEIMPRGERAAPGADPVESNKYPVYIISKGRWESRLTSKALEELGIPYHIVIEPQELTQYADVIDEQKILTLPFSNLGQGSIPARNWVWEHSLTRGAKRHWILDDNMQGFYRLNRNRKTVIKDENPFIPCERLADRYSNVALAGLNYDFFGVQRQKRPAFYLNTRIYSCILIQNDIPFRWRGRYNEDTDLSLRALKAGYCTILLNAYLCKKTATMVMKGGNTDELYAADDGRLQMAQSLVEQHPDCASITWKWGRWQHHIDYSATKRNELIPVEKGSDF